MTAVFTCYAPDIVQYVCDPRSGIPKTHKWPPTISEVHDACTDRIADLERIKRFKNWGSANDDGDERERLKDQGRLPAPVEVKPTRAEMEARHGKNWGIGELMPSDNQMGDYARTLPAGTVVSRKELIEGWRAAKLAGADFGETPASEDYKVLQGQALVDHYAAHDLQNYPKGSRPAARPIDPAMGAASAPAAPIIVDGVELDQGADF